ncbi:hypothetical protein M434DRAFT_36489 [Hypoxylon sp. CO27-5]|nr:hypothetical protein M434DRAFT_36489 [Hypoxylon sp. CO27-5]
MRLDGGLTKGQAAPEVIKDGALLALPCTRLPSCEKDQSKTGLLDENAEETDSGGLALVHFLTRLDLAILDVLPLSKDIEGLAGLETASFSLEQTITLNRYRYSRISLKLDEHLLSSPLDTNYYPITMSKLREVKKDVSSLFSRSIRKVKDYFKGLRSRDDQYEEIVQTPRTASQIPLLSNSNFIAMGSGTQEALGVTTWFWPATVPRRSITQYNSCRKFLQTSTASARNSCDKVNLDDTSRGKESRIYVFWDRCL